MVLNKNKAEYGYELAYKLACEQLINIVNIEQQCLKSGAEWQIIDSKRVITTKFLNQSYLVSFPDIDISLMDSKEAIPLRDKIRRIAKTIYGAKEVAFSEEANKMAIALKKLKLDNLPVCVAKTHLSLSHNPKRRGRPHVPPRRLY